MMREADQDNKYMIQGSNLKPRYAVFFLSFKITPLIMFRANSNIDGYNTFEGHST